MKILYFAWVREKAGVSSEDVSPPAEVTTVGALMDWLGGRGGGYTEAFSDRKMVRVAVNHAHVQADHPIAPGDEVAFFPPVTGG